MIKPPQIALVTATELPRPDPETHLLVEALGDLGVATTVVAWDKPIDWSSIPLVLLRSPWDYFRRLDEFLSWAKSVDGTTHLLNPYAIIRWNAHKSYLLDLQRGGVPVVPTTLLSANETDVALEEIYRDREVVVKPAVSIGAFGAMKSRFDDPALAVHLKTLLGNGDVLVQPYIPSVALQGEISLVFFAGAFSHAVIKRPVAGDFRVQMRYGGTVSDYTPTQHEIEAGKAALALAPSLPIYARVDLVHWDGKLALMELELIEPELFLGRFPEPVRTFARNLHRMLDLPA